METHPNCSHTSPTRQRGSCPLSCRDLLTNDDPLTTTLAGASGWYGITTLAGASGWYGITTLAGASGWYDLAPVGSRVNQFLLVAKRDDY